MKAIKRIEREATVESELKWERKLTVALQTTGNFVLCVALSLALPVVYLQSLHSQQQDCLPLMDGRKAVLLNTCKYVLSQNKWCKHNAIKGINLHPDYFG